jgi:carbonic anhydrase
VLNPDDIIEITGMALHWSDVPPLVDSTTRGLVIDILGACKTTVADTTYMLRKVHLLLPSQHSWGDRSSPLEIQFVHNTDRHERLLLAVMFREGEPGLEVGAAIASLLSKQETVRLINLVPLSRRFHVREVWDEGAGISQREVRMIHATEIAISSEQLAALQAKWRRE